MSTPTSTIGGTSVPGGPIQQQSLNSNGQSLVNFYSNIGGDNPAKSKSPLPRSLFYDGAKLDPGVKQAEKYGLFMFYSFGGGNGNNFLDQYYLSERSEYNRLISQPRSKNPTASQLVSDTAQYSSLLGSAGNTSPEGSPIKGGVHAPYYWKDFIYCKYYGTIPNNRLITLRRFSSPVLDNFSLPPGLKTPENQKLGVGMPVAQAVTWFGGNSGNKLSDLIGFSTGLNWDTKEIQEEIIQKAFGDSLLNSSAYKTLSNLVSSFSGDKTGGAGDSESFNIGAESLANSISSAGDELTKSRYFRYFFDAVKSDTTGQFGILSEKIWVPVDVIQQTSYRKLGLKFTWTDLVLKFTYDLTSTGEINTKVAMFDILGNLLSIGTNYGNFLTPYIRYDSEYSALSFPGGEDGARDYFTNPEKFISENFEKLLISDNSSSKTIGGDDISKSSLQGFEDKLKQLSEQFKTGKVDTNSPLFQEVIKGIKYYLSKVSAEEWQAPMSLYTGAAIGEWHVVIGNPYNPIAMIGNLICTGIDVDFGDSLGPDDFPNTLEATITLQHARPRERGEIESIFNQGDGRFYQTVKSTTANAQTFNSEVDLSGQVFNPLSLSNFFSPENGGLSGSGSQSVFSQQVETGED